MPFSGHTHSYLFFEMLSDLANNHDTKTLSVSLFPVNIAKRLHIIKNIQIRYIFFIKNLFDTFTDLFKFICICSVRSFNTQLSVAGSSSILDPMGAMSGL